MDSVKRRQADQNPNTQFFWFSAISQQLSFFEKFQSKLEIFHSIQENFYSNLEKFHSKLKMLLTQVWLKTKILDRKKAEITHPHITQLRD